MRTDTVNREQLQPSDLARLSIVGLRTRKLRAGLSALGIAIGVVAIVAVLGITTSSQGPAQRDQPARHNLLTVSNGENLLGAPTELPVRARAMIERIGG